MTVSQTCLARYLRHLNNRLVKYGLAALILAFLVISLGELSSPPDTSAENRKYSECNQAKPDVSSCIKTSSKPSGDKDTTHVEAPSTNKSAYEPNEFIREKRDLNAQEGVWRAGNLAARYSMLQVIIGFIGVTLIFITLVETRNVLVEAKKTTHQARLATNAAVDTLEAAITKDSPNIRAGIQCSFVNVSQSHFRAIGTFTNVGQTAALDVRIRAKFIRRLGSGFEANQARGPVAFRVDQIKPFKDGGEGSRLQIEDEGFGTVNFLGGEKERLYFVADIDYKTIFNESLNKKIILRIKPISFDDLAYTNQLKIIESGSSSISDEELASSKASAENPSNVLKIDTYECDNALALAALNVLDEHDSSVSGDIGLSMPSFGVPDEDE